MHAVPWFPKNISELDRNANKILEAGGELKSDHPVRTQVLIIITIMILCMEGGV